jgi:hypothetical protein
MEAIHGFLNSYESFEFDHVNKFIAKTSFSVSSKAFNKIQIITSTQSGRVNPHLNSTNLASKTAY